MSKSSLGLQTQYTEKVDVPVRRLEDKSVSDSIIGT